MILGMLSFNRMLLLILWGARVCLATDEREGDVLQGAEQHEEEAARNFALSILEECRNGVLGVRACMLGFVRSHTLRPRFFEIKKRLKEWKDGLDKFADVVEKFRKMEYNPDEWYSEVLEQGPYALEVNRCCKNAYDSCIGNFKDTLSQFCCHMESADFFPDLLDSRERMAGRFADLESLRDAIVYQQDDVTRLCSIYSEKASRVSVLAQNIKRDLLRRTEGDPVWKALLNQKKELFDNQYDFSRGRLIELVSKNRREINDFMLNYLIKNDKRRWEALIENAKSILRYGPLASDGDTNSFDGLDGLVALLMRHVKKRHAAHFQDDHETLFKEDESFLRFLDEKMDLMLSENALNCEGVRILEASSYGEPYN